MKEEWSSAGAASKAIRKIPATDSEKPITIYFSPELLRIIRGYFAGRRIPFDSYMTGNVLFAEGPVEEPKKCLPCANTERTVEEPKTRMPRRQAERPMPSGRNTPLTYLPEVPGLSSCCGNRISDRRLIRAFVAPVREWKW